LFSVVVHECAHGWVAYLKGDPSAKISGRLTLNPLPHIDPFMSIILPVITALSIGIPFGGAKPVPVNPFNLRRPLRDMMIIGAAGPISNILLAVGFAALFHGTRVAMPPSDARLVFIQIFHYGVFINLVLAVFNLIPVPPLDGSRVLAGLLPRQYVVPYTRLEPFGFFIIIALLMLGVIGWIIMHVVVPMAAVLRVPFV